MSATSRTSSIREVGVDNASPGSWEPILRGARREVDIVVANDRLTITHARYAAGERVAGPHLHHEHTDAFYVLEGDLVFELGREAKTLTVSSGGFVAVPPGVAHSFRTGGDRPARWLTLHAPDGGFAAFMRGVRDGVEIEWDISPVPSHGGLPASEAIDRSVTSASNRRWSDLVRRRSRPRIVDLTS